LLFLVHCDRPLVDPVYEVILALVADQPTLPPRTQSAVAALA